MFKMLQHVWSQGLGNMSMVCLSWCMMPCTGWLFLSECSTACSDSPLLYSPPSSIVPPQQRLCIFGLYRRYTNCIIIIIIINYCVQVCSWSPASAFCQMSSTVSSTSLPRHFWDPCFFCSQTNSLKSTAWLFARSSSWCQTIQMGTEDVSVRRTFETLAHKTCYIIVLYKSTFILLTYFTF